MIEQGLARSLVQTIFEAIERTPTTLLKESMAARSSPTASIILHPTTVISIFDDFALRFRITTIGPRLESGIDGSFPLIHAAADVKHQIDVLFRQEKKDSEEGKR
jgi:hypothetical protein